MEVSIPILGRLSTLETSTKTCPKKFFFLQREYVTISENREY